MEQRVPDYRINDSVSAVEPTENKTEAAVEQKATEQDKRCQRAENADRRG